MLEELPEGGVYLIPIRFDDCPIPQKLQHLHCVDAFEEGAIEHLISFLTTRLRESVYRQTAAQDRGQRLRGLLTGASQNVLRFVVIRLDGSDINWAEFPLPKKPVLFGQKYNQFFKLVEFVSDADPIFDITVKNELQTPIILTELGVQLVFGAHEEYVYGFPGTAKIKVADVYAIEIPEIKEYWDKYRRKIPSDNRGNRPFILKLQKEVVLQLPDLIQFEGHAVYRYSLRLKNYTQHVPNHTLIRFTAESDRGRVQSHLVRMFTL